MSQSKHTNGLSIEVVAILDAGAQYGKLIDRRVRQLNIKSIFMPLNTSIEEFQRQNIKAIIISGGPGSVLDKNNPRCDPRLFECGIPILGICYGMQLIVELAGFNIQRLANRQDGRVDIEITNTNSLLFKGIPDILSVLLTHGDGWICNNSVSGLDISAVSKSDNRLVVAVEIEKLKIYGVQFHPEAQLTDQGLDIFRNFLISISNCNPSFSIDNRVHKCITHIRKSVSNRKIIVLLSGGIDSAVCAALVVKAVGPQNVYCIHINNGFVRDSESEIVCKVMPEIIYKNGCIDNFIYIDATSDFENASIDNITLSQCIDPEQKRKIIGNTFINVVDAKLKQLFNDSVHDCILVQGTLRPDLIESASVMASSSACCIKTHHNDTSLVRELRKRKCVIEPLQDFHKDEVREIAKSFDFPEFLVNRHPFPGPGLAIRVLCTNSENISSEYKDASVALSKLLSFPDRYPNISLHDKTVVCNLMSKYNINYNILPIKSVGVSGDCRTYNFPVAVHCSNANLQDPIFWTDMSLLSQLSVKLIPNVNRLVYSFSNPETLTIHQNSGLSRENVNLIRRCDSVANTILGPCLSQVSQMPIILLPLCYTNNKKPPFAVVIRPVITDDFMTAIAALPAHQLPWNLMEKCISELQDIVHVVFYDLTSKPPGTTEWE